MELVDRYLQAVGFWLPRKQKEDILAELAEDLRSQMEEKEAELGHKLSEAEVEALLKQRGRPVLVANRYLPQQYLIGPVLFPIYRFVLMAVGLGYLACWTVASIVLMFYRAQHAQPVEDNWVKTLLTVWGSWWGTTFLAWGVVTIVFAVLERVNASSHFIEEWEPRDLPALRVRNRIPRSSSIFEVAALIAFSVWWTGYMWSPVMINRPDVRIVLSPSLWSYFFWGVGLLTLASLSVSAVNLVRPYWTRLRASLRLVTNLGGAALFCWALKAHILAEVTVANVPAARTTEITNAINLWADRAFPFAVIGAVVVLAVDIYRIARLKAADGGARQQAIATTS